MKNRILLFTTVVFAAAIIIFISCEKSSLSSKSQAGNRVQLVPLDTARYVAAHFNPSLFFHADDPSNHSPFRSSLTGNNQIENYNVINDAKGLPAIYVFNFTNNRGFVFISADYQLRPVLAFMENGNFKKDTVPAGLMIWTNTTLANIEGARNGLFDMAGNTDINWKEALDQNYRSLHAGGSTGSSSDKVAPPPPTDPCQTNPDYYTSTTTTVGPLLPVTWGQDCSYNNLCPNQSCSDCSSNAVTGCVATAMSQVIRFWSPTNSFAYNYASMPATYGNSEVQRLMHDAGLKVNMSYGCGPSGGSSASGGDVPGALKSNFGFTSANRSSYGSGSYATVQSNISNHWPVLLEGCNDQTNRFLGIWYTRQNCHEWVCDGTQSTTVTNCYNGSSLTESYLYFHMNWGWHEVGTSNDYNGWFAFDNWKITGAGQGGSDLNFKYANSMTTSIHP